MNKLVKTENEHLHASGGLVIPHEVADGITVTVLKDQLAYLLKEQRWFECPVADRFALEEEHGYRLWVHPDDYAKNRDELIPALRSLIAYFGGVE
jgi:hypothetical protein